MPSTRLKPKPTHASPVGNLNRSRRGGSEGDTNSGTGIGKSSGTSSGKRQRAVQSIEVGGRLLLALSHSHGPMTLKDLAAAAALPAARAHPYLVSFGKLGFIEQVADSGHYALGPAALQLGLTCLQQLDPVTVAWPVVQALAASTGQAAALAVWGNFGPTIVRMVEARQPLHVAMRAGTVMSILGTATGRAFAAALPDENIHKALMLAQAQALGGEHEGGGRRPPYKPQPQQAQALRAAVAEVRAHGLARAIGRPMPGVNAFSAAAYTHEGEVALVITLLGHQDHLAPHWNGSAARAVRLAADQVSARLGWRPVKAAAPLPGKATRQSKLRAGGRPLGTKSV